VSGADLQRLYQTAVNLTDMCVLMSKFVDVPIYFWSGAGWAARVEDGRYALDVMLEAAPSLRSQLDLYWVAYGGADPVEVLGRIGKRVILAHVKDGLLGGDAHFTAAGCGQVNLPAAIGALDPAVVEWLIVEQDQSDGDMLADVQTSYTYLTSNGLAAGNR
jgi:sugar phosphate isomerase/epimerase